MTKEQLIALRDRVAAFDEADKTLSGDILVAFGFAEWKGKCLYPKKGADRALFLLTSVDHALFFKDRLLPGCIAFMSHGNDQCGTFLIRADVSNQTYHAPTLPLAIILAVLEALISGAE